MTVKTPVDQLKLHCGVLISHAVESFNCDCFNLVSFCNALASNVGVMYKRPRPRIDFLISLIKREFQCQTTIALQS